MTDPLPKLRDPPQPPNGSRAHHDLWQRLPDRPRRQLVAVLSGMLQNYLTRRESDDRLLR